MLLTSIIDWKTPIDVPGFHREGKYPFQHFEVFSKTKVQDQQQQLEMSFRLHFLVPIDVTKALYFLKLSKHSIIAKMQMF